MPNRFFAYFLLRVERPDQFINHSEQFIVGFLRGGDGRARKQYSAFKINKRTCDLRLRNINAHCDHESGTANTLKDGLPTTG